MVRCSKCKKPLHGIPSNIKNLPKSKKRVERKFGGNLCSSCARKEINRKIFKTFST